MFIKWLKKKTTISPNYDDDRFFQYIATIALDYEKIGENLQRIIKHYTFKNKYNWYEISFPSEKDDYKRKVHISRLNFKIQFNP